MPDTDTGRRVARDGFGLPPQTRITLLSQGRVNLTFLLETPARRYILQRLHPVFGNDGAVADNTAAVADAMEAAGMPAPTVIPAEDGRNWVQENGLWRLTKWLPGQTIEHGEEKVVREAAGLLGRFHRILAHSGLTLRELPPADYKRPPRNAQDWEMLIRRYESDPKFREARTILEKGLALGAGLPRFTPAASGIIHGDPKLQNILFSNRKTALTLIDLDTVRHGFLLWELADALRSWAAVPVANGLKTFSPRLIDVAISAYQDGGLPLSPSEWTQLIPGIKAITLNLAWRYLNDYFEESYFAWDQTRYRSLAAQNLHRGAQYVEMAESID